MVLKRHVSLLAIALLMIAVFLVDLYTPLGYVPWVLYIVPVGLALMLPWATAPLIVAGFATVSMIFGYYGSPVGIDTTMAIANRIMGTLAVWIFAILAWRLLVARNHNQHQAWLQEGGAIISRGFLGEKSLEELGTDVLSGLCKYVGADVGVMYRKDGRKLLRAASFALSDGAPEVLKLGEGLPGQVAQDGKTVVLAALPAGYLKVSSALGSKEAGAAVICAISADKSLYGVIELGFLQAPSDIGRIAELLEAVSEDIGVSVRTAVLRQRLVELLEETQRQSEELQAQQEELRVSNEELEEQGRALRESQARLENQQAELEQTNVQLEEQTQILERQKQDLLTTQRALQENATELERTSRYKSEFLANMSHELRTPLNSSLILAKLLAENKNGTLTPEQVHHASTIHAANTDLLNLINDILDLSRVEAGHMEVHVEGHALADIVDPVARMFEPQAQEKSLQFEVSIAPSAPGVIFTDGQRLQQILKNLLANAMKFTAQGSVGLSVSRADDAHIVFSVTDTGIGIPKEQQGIIFEAFRQADGTTSRKYGGSGLGLSICRELARLLGGEIRVDSEPGRGSSFSLQLPIVARPAGSKETPRPAAPSREPGKATATADIASTPAPAPSIPHIADDRQGLGQRPRIVLVVEDDTRFAHILYDLAHELDFDCVHAPSAAEAIKLAREIQPHGILLDVGLPDASGLTVLEQLKRDAATRHIPIHVISANDHTQMALELGAVGYALKPVAREDLAQALRKLEQQFTRRIRKVLVVEDDPSLRETISLLLGADDIDIHAVGSMKEALDALSSGTFDCMVMDLVLPDGSGYELLQRMSEGDRFAFPPVIIYTGRALSREEEERLRRYSSSIIIKGARSPERLLDEVTLFLHRVESSLPPDQQRLLRQARERDGVFEGRRILLAEDDVRNVYALSAVFEGLGATLEIARNGREALERVTRSPDINLVLMDIMMPEMDGLTAMREIRKRPTLAKLPIIALTAKAMADDRQHCLDAGANDYIPKPVDIDKLISLCRVWLPK